MHPIAFTSHEIVDNRAVNSSPIVGETYGREMDKKNKN